jgi:uncharacterized MnhB-related membrane protein
MLIDLTFDLILVICILTLAIGALFVRDVFTAIVLFIGLGLLMTVAWVRLNAIDVAIAEASIGAGLTGALLLGAWKRLKSLKRVLEQEQHSD